MTVEQGKPTEAGHVILGGRRYRVERDFGRLTAGSETARISQVAVDAAGRVHVLRRGEPPVLVFEPDGAFAYAYGEGEIFDLHGIAIDGHDRVWIADRDAHQILAFTTRGARAAVAGRAPCAALDAAVQPSDARRGRAPTARSMCLTAMATRASNASRPKGEFLGGFGDVGLGRGEFMTPAFDRDRPAKPGAGRRSRERPGAAIRSVGRVARRMERTLPSNGSLRARRRRHSGHRSGSQRHRLCPRRPEDRSRPAFAQWVARDRRGRKRRALSCRDRSIFGDQTRPGPMNSGASPPMPSCVGRTARLGPACDPISTQLGNRPSRNPASQTLTAGPTNHIGQSAANFAEMANRQFSYPWDNKGNHRKSETVFDYNAGYIARWDPH